MEYENGRLNFTPSEALDIASGEEGEDNYLAQRLEPVLQASFLISGATEDEFFYGELSHTYPMWVKLEEGLARRMSSALAEGQRIRSMRSTHPSSGTQED
ncbi:MAG TPA: hypothetical protein VLG25_02825 [Patescibacteria group bacterium]|nr:hypothetical protein [Patescibacteria group bacterium]